MDALDATVCLLSFKRPNYLSEAIDSVLAQTRSPAEFIIFDDGSGKEVEEVAGRYRDRGVIFEGAGSTKGSDWNFARALNRIATKHVLFMHDDDRLCPDFLEKQVSFLNDHPDILAVFCNCHLIDSSGRRIGILKPYAMNKIFNSGADVAMVYAGGSCLPYPTGVYRTEYVRQIERRTEFKKVTDVVFMCDLADRGPIAYRKAPLYEYRIHDMQDSSVIPQEILSMLDEFLLARIGESPRLSTKKRRYAARRYTREHIRGLIENYRANRPIHYTIGGIYDIDFKRFSLMEAIEYIALLLMQKRGMARSLYGKETR